MLSAARGLTDPLACDPVTDLVGPSGFKINGGRVSGLPQGVFVGGDSLPKVEGRGDRFDPETEVRPAPGQPLAPAVGYPQHRVLEVFRIPFDGDAVAFRLVDEGEERGVIADLDGRPFEVRGWAVDPLGGTRVAVALLFGEVDGGFGGGAEGEAGEIAAESVEDRRFREPLPCRRVRGRELRVGPGLEYRGCHRALQLDGRANLPGADLHVHVRLLRHELKTVDKLSGKRPRDAPGRLA